MSELHSDEPTGLTELHARVMFSVPDHPVTLVDVSAALFDFNLLYEIALLAGAPQYQSWDPGPRAAGPWFWTRNARRIRPQDRLLVLKVQHESPLDLLVAIPATIAASATAIWAVVQAWERIVDRPLNSWIRQNEAVKVYFESQRARIDYENALQARDLQQAEERVRRRIDKSALRPEDIEFE